MRRDVRFLDPADAAARRAWDAAVHDRPRASVFHTTAWLDVVRHGLGLEPRFAYLPGANGSIRALIPLFRAGGRMRNVRWLNLPQSCPSDPLAATEADATELLEQVAALAADEGAAALILRTPRKLSPHVPAGWALRREEPVLRHAIDLGEARDVQTLPNIQTGQRKSFRAVRCRMKEAGGRVRYVSRCDAGDFTRAVHHIFLRRHGHLGLPVSFFDALLHFLPDKARLQLVCPAIGPPLAFSILILNPNYGHLLYGSGLPTTEGIGAYRLSVGTQIEETIGAGLRRFDFGEAGPEQDGLIFFKETWGAVAVDGSYLVIAQEGTKSGLQVIGQSFALAQRIFQYLPVGLSLRIAGPIHKVLQ
jgi:Acetyltransferase (GNAT) domain